MTAVRAGELVFTGGVAGNTNDLFPRLADALAAEGATLADVVELTTFHADVREIDDLFAAGADTLSEPFPAWTPVGMVGPAPGGETVIAQAVAHIGKSEKTSVVPDTIAWWRGRPWSAGCRKGDLVAIAGLHGADADGNIVMPGLHDGQARNALNRMKEVCELLGVGLDDVVDVCSFHHDPRGIEACREVAAGEFFTNRVPPWTAAGAPALYRFGMLAQFQALAEVGQRRVTVHTAEAVEAIAPLRDQLVEVVAFHKDVRDADEVREAVGDGPAWTAVGMTGFGSEDSRHAIRALAVRS
jgi:enamine deaminase RidA (YjgF/YER057c/UK114 family)